MAPWGASVILDRWQDERESPYTDAGGRIELTAGSIGESVEIRVQDNGIGIEPAALPVVFDLFTQSSQLNGRSQTGLGIGLALAKRLVEMHGGDVQAHSDGPGKGSEFVVRLPRHTGELAAAAGHTGTTPAPQLTPSTVARRILVADDNRDALETLVQLLQLGGHEIHKAADGVEALEAATRMRPDLVLLDIGMPGMDGYEVARRIRSQPWGREATLVALTGWGQENDRKRSREAGFDSHCIKPLDMQRLFSLLASLPAAGNSSVEPTRVLVNDAHTVAARRIWSGWRARCSTIRAGRGMRPLNSMRQLKPHRNTGAATARAEEIIR